ncbi:MAG: hypothetical protein ABIH28_02005 [archaeon]
MENVFEVTDKTGRKIRLTKKQWYHMTKKHPYMEKYFEEIKETLTAPDKLINYSDKGYYYKNYKNLKAPNRFILVIVRYLNNEGFIITSYLEAKIK